MSILRLLAAGKSLIGGQNTTGRYRLDKRARLPNFGTTKNPFAADPRKPAQPEATMQNAPAPEPIQPNHESHAKPTPTPARLRQAVRWLRDWYTEGKPQPRPVRAANQPQTHLTRAPIQSELTLDEIKVVRNDLTDADLEIVPAKPVRRAEATPPQPEDNTWSRITTRIFVRTGDPD